MVTMTKKNLTTYFEYLDDLRKSGAVNMFGAAPYIKAQFKLSQKEANTIWAAWAETFSDELASVRAAKVKP